MLAIVVFPDQATFRSRLSGKQLLQESPPAMQKWQLTVRERRVKRWNCHDGGFSCQTKDSPTVSHERTIFERSVEGLVSFPDGQTGAWFSEKQDRENRDEAEGGKFVPFESRKNPPRAGGGESYTV